MVLVEMERQKLGCKRQTEEEQRIIGGAGYFVARGQIFSGVRIGLLYWH